MEKQGIFITPSEIIEYLFCPRFTFFMNCLSIPQHEEKRYKVLKGRELHEQKAKINRGYLRKKIACVKKDTLVYLSSSRYHLKGEVDEVLHLADGTLAPSDYKFAEYKDTIYRTHKIQSVLYALLIKDNYQREVKRGYLCYIRNKYVLKAITFDDKDFRNAQQIIEDVLKVIQSGFYPQKTKSSVRCIDCCYRNICV
ncbi:MAG: CRISPR-associated protein Cas4 [Thermodesulfobacteriota bacterium]|nr:CRISPR-associated protein Cas4 [Thermodesulfobacteriota bacterium]